jgi:hypothetical protein
METEVSAFRRKLRLSAWASSWISIELLLNRLLFEDAAAEAIEIACLFRRITSSVAILPLKEGEYRN